MSVFVKRIEAVTIASHPAVVTPIKSSADTLFGHPKGLFILFFTEMWERFSYYGMRALLLLYMVEALRYDTHRAGAVYGMYTGLVYLTPVLGGYLADRYLGQRRAILVGGLLMAAGHFIMAVDSIPFFYGALGLLVLGNGFFKPNISVIVGQLYERDDPRRDGAFSIFYMGINVGAFFSPLVCGTLGQRLGWHYGFAAAGVGMVVGVIIYLLGQRHLGRHGMAPVPRSAQSAPQPRAPLTRHDLERLAVLVVLAIFGNVVFWAAFEQAGGSLTLFAEHATDLRVPLIGWSMPSTWFQSANPLFITLLAPLMSIMWVALAKRQREPSTPLKFVLGLGLLAAGFFTMVLAGQQFDSAGPVSMMWLTAAYFLNTCGELCCSPVGLSAVTKLAPPRFGSLVMGLWMASMAFGNYLAGMFTGEYETMSKATFFSIPVYTAGAAAVVLIFMVKPLRRAMHGIH